jgi:FkbM family methyltransferase
MNALRRTLYWLALLYFDYSPLKRGKWRFLSTLSAFLGDAIYNRNGLALKLRPVALLDRKLIQREDPNPILSNIILDTEWRDSYFLDIGANIGYFSLLAASKGATVIAFEPSRRELTRLYSNIVYSNLFSISVFPVALSDSEATMMLDVSDAGNPGLNSLKSESRADGTTVSVPVKKLSEVLSGRLFSQVRLVKIDVEGHELRVLRGMESVMGDLKKARFVIEITPTYLQAWGHTARDIYAFFEQHNFKPKFGPQACFQWDEMFSAAD